MSMKINKTQFFLTILSVSIILISCSDSLSDTTDGRLRYWISTLASDEFEGRAPGTEGGQLTKNFISKNKFREMFKKRNIKKNYLAFAYGVLNQHNIEINRNITRNKVQRTKFNISDDLGKNAITKVSNIKTFHGSISLLDCEIITGRTHQIRVHLLSLGLPIIGDKDYNFNIEQKLSLIHI